MIWQLWGTLCGLKIDSCYSCPISVASICWLFTVAIILNWYNLVYFITSISVIFHSPVHDTGIHTKLHAEKHSLDYFCATIFIFTKHCKQTAVFRWQVAFSQIGGKTGKSDNIEWQPSSAFKHFKLFIQIKIKLKSKICSAK